MNSVIARDSTTLERRLITTYDQPISRKYYLQHPGDMNVINEHIRTLRQRNSQCAISLPTEERIAANRRRRLYIGVRGPNLMLTDTVITQIKALIERGRLV